MIVNIQQAKVHLSKYIEKALAGEEIILSKSGKPSVVLMPLISSHKKRKPVIFGILAGKITVPDNFDDPLPDEICQQFYTPEL